MNIEFGCGENPRQQGYKTCDIRDLPGIDFVCSAWDIDQLVEPDSVENIYSFHFFEHLTFDQGHRVLASWYRILQPGGRVEIVLPNMEFHVKQWLSGRDRQHACAGFWGWQRDTDQDQLWDVHKSGYDHLSLAQTVEQHGFRDYQRLPMRQHHLRAQFRK